MSCIECSVCSASNHVVVVCVYRDDGNDLDDFVFEEFVRLRVAGIEENNETEA